MMRNEYDEGCISERLERMIDSDDKDNFVKLLEANPGEITKSLLEKCAKHGARECLLALLKGEEIGHPPPLLDHQGDSKGVTALAYAAHCCPDPEIIELMLNKCNASSQLNVASTIACVHGLPIHFLLLHLSYRDPLFFWARGESLIVLVIFLCLSKMKPILDSVRLLAHCSDSINTIAWTLVHDYGALKQFAALLLVSREKVVAPFDSGLTIRQRLTDEISKLSQGDIGTEQVEYICMLTDAVQFLDLFETAGDALSSYCSSMHENVEINHTVGDVCKMLKQRKVYVSALDLRLDRFIDGTHAWFNLDGEWICDLSFYVGWLHFNPTAAIPQYGYDSLPMRESMWDTSPATQRNGFDPLTKIRLPSSATQQFKDGSIPWIQARMMSTRACHARKISERLEYASVNHSLVRLAHMTMKLKKGLRCL